MKTYDREKKKWVEADRHQNKRDADVCRGKKEHDYVLVLPDGVIYLENYGFRPKEYYRIMDEILEFKTKKMTEIEKMGILPRWSWSDRKETRLYMCSVCKKKKYEYEK